MHAEEPRRRRGTLHVYVAGAMQDDGRVRVGAVFTDVRGRVLRRIRRVLPRTASEDLAAFRGILYALWTSLKLGATGVVVHSDNPGIVGQINGDREVDPNLVGPYLQVRALLHAYRRARVQADHMGWSQEALAVGETASDHYPGEEIDGLPLWVGSAMRERSTA